MAVRGSVTPVAMEATRVYREPTWLWKHFIHPPWAGEKNLSSKTRIYLTPTHLLTEGVNPRIPWFSLSHLLVLRLSQSVRV